MSAATSNLNLISLLLEKRLLWRRRRKLTTLQHNTTTTATTTMSTTTTMTTMITVWQKNLEMAFDEINDTGDNDVACFAFTEKYVHKTFPSTAIFSLLILVS